MTREHSDAGDLELRRLLRDLRKGPAAPLAARSRLGNALGLAGGPPPAMSGTTPTAHPAIGRLATASRASSLWALGGVGAVAVLGVWLSLGVVLSGRSGRSSGMKPAAVEQRRPRDDDSIALPSAPTYPIEIDPIAGDLEKNAVALEREVLGSQAAPGPKSERRAARDVSLSAERRLIEAARAALVAGDALVGLQKLTQHARQFSHGVLAEEREALSVDALVAAGRYGEARRQADVFRARYPGSLFAPSIAAALQAIP